ncbi:hypothetical protein TNCV_4054221 [Trichonephila clavipes]|nr:hypothetical protein TNCV_4054221 [Trichonephila clavipes]
MPAMIRYLDHWATAAPFMYENPVSWTVVTHVGAPVAWGPRIIATEAATPLGYTLEIMDEILTTARDLKLEVNEDDIEELIMGHEDELTNSK